MKPVRLPVRPQAILRPFKVAGAPSSQAQCLRLRGLRQPTRSFLRRARNTSSRPVENFNLDRMHQSSYDYYMRRQRILGAGALAGVISFIYTGYLLYLELQKPNQFDSKPETADPFSTEAGSKRKTVVHDEEGREIVPTGNSVAPSFPRTMDLTVGAADGQQIINGVEYTLVGLGIRTVSFLGIQVYLVGYYIATQDVAAIQNKLVKEINSIATTLIPSERDELRRRLLDPAEGEKLWQDIMKDVAPRSAFRIVPVKDTDFHHLRDGFVRAITARTQKDPQAYGDEGFSTAMKDFRAMFNRGKAPKNSEMILVRDERGVLSVLFNSKSGTQAKSLDNVGSVADERISKALWFNYLAGNKVASEAARVNIVDGIMEFVERPVGTVAAQVV